MQMQDRGSPSLKVDFNIIKILFTRLISTINSDHRNWEGTCIRVCFSFFFSFIVFHAKSRRSNNHRNGSRDISY